MEKGFSERGATELSKEYRRTMSFARLMDGNECTEPEDHHDMQVPLTVKRSQYTLVGHPMNTSHLASSYDKMENDKNVRELQIPLFGKTALLRVPYPMTEMDWTIMQSVLSAMKPGLVLADGKDLKMESSSQCDNSEEKGGENQ